MCRQLAIVAIVLSFAASVVGCSGWGIDGYVEKWSASLTSLEDPADTQGLPPSEWTDGVWVRRFQSGEWVAARATDPEVSHRSGGFDATVFCDSNGLVQVDTSTHVCTFDALDEYLGESAIEATGLVGFYEAVEADHWVLEKH